MSPLRFVGFAASACLLVACGDVDSPGAPDVDGGALPDDDGAGGSDEGSSADGEEPGDGGADDGDDDGDGHGDGDDGKAPGGGDGGDPPVVFEGLPRPRAACGDAECIMPGTAFGGATDGRDLLRTTFYRVRGYPDAEVYDSLTAVAGYTPPYAGVVDSLDEVLGALDDRIAAAGLQTCDELPVDGDDGDSLRFSEGQHEPPAGFPYAGVGYDKRIRAELADGVVVAYELTCGRAAGWASLFVPLGVGHAERFEVYFDAEKPGEDRLEVIVADSLWDERVAFRFVGDGLDYELWSATSRRVDVELDRYVGVRIYARGDARAHQSSVFGQILGPYDDLYKVQPAWSYSLGDAQGTFRRCAQLEGDGIFDDALCPGLPVTAPQAPGFDDDAGFSIAWVAAPPGEEGLVDAFESLL